MWVYYISDFIFKEEMLIDWESYWFLIFEGGSMMEVILYTTDCPKCKILEKKLNFKKYIIYSGKRRFYYARNWNF